MFLSFKLVYVVDYIDGFQYIVPPLHPWDEGYSIVVNYCFDSFLDSAGQNFICISVHKGNRSEVIFPCLVYDWFRHKHSCGFIE